MSATAVSKPPSKRQVETDLCRYDHARMEPSQGLMPGLYTPLPSGPRSNRLVTYRYDSGVVVEHRCYEAFGADDLRLHLAILAMRGGKCRQLTTEPGTETGSFLRSALQLRGEAAEQDTVTVRCSYHELAGVIGLSSGGGGGGNTWRLLHRGLARGAADLITLLRERPQTKRYDAISAGTAMSFCMEAATGLIAVALHPLLAHALLDPEAPYRRIDLREMRALGSDVACILHTYLSAWLRPGESQVVGVDTLAGHVYGGPGSYPGEVRCRRFQIRQALESIDSLSNWKIGPAPDAKSGGQQVQITRRRQTK